MHRLLRQTVSKRLTNYNLLRRSITSINRPLTKFASATLPITPLHTLQAKRVTLLKRFMTTYKETPFLQWKLFPDFQKLVNETSPAIAVPAFEKIIEAAKEQFIAIEKTFEPTWDGTIGKCKINTLYLLKKKKFVLKYICISSN